MACFWPGAAGERLCAPVGFILLLIAAACSAGHAVPEGSGEVQGASGELTVHRGRFEDRFLLTGQLVAVNADNLVVPRIPSWQTTVRWLEVEGAVVKTGQKVVEFDTATFAQELSEKRVASAQARSDLEQSEADRAEQRADKTFAVAQKSIAVEKAKIAAATPVEFVRGKDYQDNQLALSRAETELAKAREDLAAFEASSTSVSRWKNLSASSKPRVRPWTG
jgi:hypothetical protein